MTTAGGEKTGGGFALLGLLVGLAAGLVIFVIGEYWFDDRKFNPLALTSLFATSVFAGVLLLLTERGRFLRALLPAGAVALILSGPTWFLLSHAGDSARVELDAFPLWFWLCAGAPLAGFLMTALAKAALTDGAPPPYRAVFIHGLTLPLIAGGALLFAVLTLVLLFAWARLLDAMNVDLFDRLLKELWFTAPVFGAVGGLSIALMRGLESVLGALRYIILLLSRILMPVTAVFSLTFVAAVAVNGAQTILESGFYPGGLMTGLAFVGMLIFNGVYQNGEGGPPPLWLRLATIITLAAFPIYAGMAAWAFWLRIGEYGLTPARIVGAAMTGLAAVYALVCLAGLLTELAWRGRKWMPLVAPLNTAMCAVWIAVLLALASPVLNPWALSAASQEARLAEGRVAAAEFDYGFMRFGLGPWGEKSLDRLLANGAHPEAAAIRAGIERVRAASDGWTYQYGDLLSDDETGPLGPMQLELNPEGADYGEEDDAVSPSGPQEPEQP